VNSIFFFISKAPFAVFNGAFQIIPGRDFRGARYVRIFSRRELQASLKKVSRPDLGESLPDYGFSKAGFGLALQGDDHRPISLSEVVPEAHGTVKGDGMLRGGGWSVTSELESSEDIATVRTLQDH
jgi:hypothetical protein